MRCWAAVVAYEGTDFAGFQLQLQAGDPRARTVQGALEAAVERVTGQPRAAQSMIAAGRTDRGVHARGQLVSFLTGVRGRGGAPLDPDRLARALNGVLPPDVRVARVIAVPPDFSAHYACLSKIYEYDLATGPYVDPFARRTCAAFPGPFDVDRAREACRALEGAHDFTQLSTRAADGAERDPRRMVLSCTVQALAGGHGCRIRVQGAGFLYRQVRHMVGAVAAVARGRCSLAALQERLAVGGRVPRGELPPLWAVAPPQGLTLRRGRGRVAGALCSDAFRSYVALLARSAVEVPDPLPLPEDLMFPGLPHAESGLVDGAAVLAMDGTHLEDAIGAYLGRTGSGTLLTGVYSDSLHPLPSEVA